MDIWRSADGTELAVVAATWELQPKTTFESLLPELEKNPVSFARNYASIVGKGGGSPAIRDSAVILAHRNLAHVDPWDYARQTFYHWFRGRRDRRYFIHIDLAKSKDRVGVACVHQEPGATPKTPGIVIVDFMHRHEAIPGRDIQFAEIREKYVYALHARDFHIQQVTLDQWQSVEFRQVLQAQGFETDEVSADKTTGPYDTLIELLLTKRLDYYDHPVFTRELEQLQTNGIKYDHPKTGSKDVSDAVACAVWSAIHYVLENPDQPKAALKVHRAAETSRGRQRFTPSYGERSVW